MIQAATTLELLHKVEAQNLYVALIEQLNKDLQMCNLNVEFETSTTPFELKSALHKLLIDLIHNNYDTYLNLLYRIDIKEIEMLKISTENTVDSIAQVVFLILKREAQKVWLRKNFSPL